MATKYRIAWDSCVIIDLLDSQSSRHTDVLPMYQDAMLGKIDIIVSEISVAEVCKLVNLVSSGRIAIASPVSLIKQFFDHKFILRRPVDRKESSMAADITRSHNLETCDAIIVATAAIHHACVLYTRDGKKRRNNQPSPLKCDGQLGTPPLPIKEPDASVWTGQPLFPSRDPNAGP